MTSLLKQANAIGRHEKNCMGKPLPKDNSFTMNIKAMKTFGCKTNKRHTGAKMIGEI